MRGTVQTEGAEVRNVVEGEAAHGGQSGAAQKAVGGCWHDGSEQLLSVVNAVGSGSRDQKRAAMSPGSADERVGAAPPPPRYGIRMRVHDRYRQAQSRSAKQKSKREALQ